MVESNVNLSYRQANPRNGNESFLLRFEDSLGQAACVLVDSGQGVDVDDLLGEDDYLAAIVLTHAHADHYRSIGRNLCDGAPIFTSEGTAEILETTLSDAENYTDAVNDVDAILDAVEPLDGWESPIEGLRLTPIPTGHAPGAAAFLFQFDGGDGPETILATGDWTREQAAGYPGFDTSLLPDVGAVFLTGAANGSYDDSLTESIAKICERAHAGSPVLATATGLNGIKYGYLLGHFADQFNHPLQVTLAGQVAKLYDDLDYSVPNLETVPEFSDPSTLISPETVTIAGPEEPTEGSSGALFDVVRNDPTATLVQVRSSGGDSVPSTTCSAYDFEVVAHPPDDEIDAMVESLDPMQVIVTHQHRGAASRFKERYNSFVWANSNPRAYTLFKDGEWKAPPWMSEEGIAHAYRTDSSEPTRQLSDATDRSGALTIPSCERTDNVDLAAEGLDIDSLDEQFRRPDAKTRSDDSQNGQHSSAPTNESSTEVDRSRPDSPSRSSQDSGSIASLMDSIEAKTKGETASARVVDAGDGITLIWLNEDIDLQDGDEVEVVVQQIVKND